MTGTSIFDPVLTELAYRWFCPPGGTIIDPFAGGSVRGVVAGVLGYQYIGVDLRAEQIDANREQWTDIEQRQAGAVPPVWHTGDSRNIRTYLKGVQADLVFTCPPYADLEVYSDDPSDISNMEYPEFLSAYREIISETVDLLRNDRFAVIVIGEARGRDGNYYGLVPDTIAAFKSAGLEYYNEAILVTPAGSLPVRAGKQFSSGRKIGKTHQNVLVFVKGDGKRAAKACGDIAIDWRPENENGPAEE